jgi:predicted secreted acid phosphatase
MKNRWVVALLLLVTLVGATAIGATPQAKQAKIPVVTSSVPIATPALSPLNSGLYQSFQLAHQQALASVYQTATKTIQTAQQRGETAGWVVLDLDETVLDNRAYFIANGLYKPELWKPWLLLAQAPAITGSVDFVRFLQQQQIPFAFLSGRREAQRDATLQNLLLLGLPTTVPVLMKANDFPEGKTAIEFKQAHRCELEAQSSVKVWMLIGDQWSDLRGDCRGKHQLKLPNPIYTVE